MNQMKDQIENAVQAAIRCSCKVEITFKLEATTEILSLLKMNIFDNNDVGVLRDVAFVGDWGRNINNRAFVVDVPIDEQWFIDNISRVIEKIEVVQ